MVKVGGPVYRIGVGGGSASSMQVSTFAWNLQKLGTGSWSQMVWSAFSKSLLMSTTTLLEFYMVQVQGDNKKELDFNAVQRGDAEMEQKLNRFVRSCIEFENDENPILSIHDQGAGGNGEYVVIFGDGRILFLFILHGPEKKDRVPALGTPSMPHPTTTCLAPEMEHSL